MQQNIILYTIIAIILIIVISFFVMKEKYQPVNDTVYDNNPLNQKIPDEPNLEMQIGTTTISQQMMNEIGAEQQIQNDFSAGVTRNLEMLQEQQINDSEINQQTNVVQKTNEAVSDTKFMSIFHSGMAKRGGLSEGESNRIAATKQYMQFDQGFDDNKIPDSYQNILGSQQNSTVSITSSNVVLNADNNKPYVPNVGTGIYN